MLKNLNLEKKINFVQILAIVNNEDRIIKST